MDKFERLRVQYDGAPRPGWRDILTAALCVLGFMGFLMVVWSL